MLAGRLEDLERVYLGGAKPGLQIISSNLSLYLAARPCGRSSAATASRVFRQHKILF
jgi:hypothetical protein